MGLVSRWFVRVLLSGLLLIMSADLLAIDCNRNGVDDGEETSSGQADDCNDNLVPDECEFLPPEFGTRPDRVVLPGVPRGVAAGDFDGDGRFDLAVASGGNRTDPSVLSVYFGSEDEGFLEDGRLLEVGLELSDLSAGDVDGDGDLDLATAHSTFVLVFENDGRGSFREVGRLDVPERTEVVRLGDLSGDGLSDLIVANVRDDTVTVFPGEGAWTFGIPSTRSVHRNPQSLVVADLDGDGDLDVASANRDSRDASVLLSAEGLLGEAAHYPAGGLTPASVLAVDLDDDGLLDLALSTRQAVTVLRNQGGGVFAAPISFDFSGSTSTGPLVAADFDGDGDTDLAASVSDPERNALSVFMNQGGGTLGAPASFATESFVRFARAADFDQDGDLDVAILMSTSALRVLWNNESDGLSLEATTFDLGARPHAAALADVDLDGNLDLVTGNGGGRSLSVVRSRDDGSFATPVRISSGQYINSMVFADMDEDGDPDIVTADMNGNRVWVLTNSGRGGFSGQRSFPAGSRPVMVQVGDFNADGVPDAVSANEAANSVSVLVNAGDGNLTGGRTDLPSGPRNQTHTPVAVAAGDLDGDGDDDLAVANNASGTVGIIMNLLETGGGFAPARLLTVPARPDYVVAADIDGDRSLDLAVASDRGDLASVYLNQGDGTFVLAQSIPGAGGYSIATADVDGDGSLDLISSSVRLSAVAVVLGSGDGTLRDLSRFEVGRQPRFALPGDLGGDGDIDIIATNRTSNNFTVLENQAAATDFREDYARRICTERDYYDVSVLSRRGNTERTTKYTLPARPPFEAPDLLPALFMNARRHLLHEEFLRTVFPERFPALSPASYNLLVGRRATREYFAGFLNRLRLDGEGPVYGFSVVVDTSDPAELLTMDEVAGIYEKLRESFTLGPLGYAPDTSLARQSAERWVNPPFPVYLDDGSSRITYEAYTRAVGYGRVRLLDEESFRDANERGEISFQSILVLSFAPRDIEGVVGGVVTAETQGELSHLAIRTARRQTPNAFVRDAPADFATWEGKLVRLEVTESKYSVVEATVEEAEAWWAENRPRLSVQPRLDRDFTELSNLDEIAAMDLGGGPFPVEARFGGKASNLARLGRILGPEFEEYRERGFAIPMHYYFEFLRQNRMPSALDPARQVTYEEHLQELLDRPEFQSDSTLRFRALDRFREHAREHGVVDPELMERLIGRIGEVFSSSTAVRFRSSSNVEDALEFNGAGLYESTGVCTGDNLDADESGPSLCDPSQPDERTVERALKKVWTSLWTFRAYEERAFYGIDQDTAGMGILVSRAFLDEASNGVAFTGNIANPLDKRYVITVQVGEESVVSPEPGVEAEKDLLEMEAGRVKRIIRPARGSSLVPPGTWVLSDGQLEELGRLMAHVDEHFPIEVGDHRREEVLLDLEFKIESSGELAVKQARAFLLTVPAPPTPVFELEIPEGLVACGVFGPAGVDRGPREEYERKSRVRLRGGVFELPTATVSFPAGLVEELRFGPEQEIAVPESEGLFRVVRVPGPGGITSYRFGYEQEFSLSDGRGILFRTTAPLEFRAKEEEPIEGSLLIDERFLTTLAEEERFEAVIAGDPVSARYGACGHSLLERWAIEARLEDGVEVYLEERWDPQAIETATGPASLVHAEVTLDGDRHVVSDYWHLVYSAFRHNRGVRYWVVFETPLSVAGLEADVHALELSLSDVAELDTVTTEGTLELSYLGADFETLGAVELPFTRETAQEARFVRGDVDSSGSLGLRDAIVLLRRLFAGAEPLACEAGADADSDGVLGLSDALYVLSYLFRSGPPPRAPFPGCGPGDPQSALGCRLSGPCR